MRRFLVGIQRINAGQCAQSLRQRRGRFRPQKLWLRLDRPGQLRCGGRCPATTERAVEIDLRQQQVIFNGHPIQLG